MDKFNCDDFIQMSSSDETDAKRVCCFSQFVKDVAIRH